MQECVASLCKTQKHKINTLTIHKGHNGVSLNKFLNYNPALIYAITNLLVFEAPQNCFFCCCL